MKVIKKIPVFLLTMILCIGLMAMPAFAASSSQDGLEVTLTTDKESYSQSEQIVATLTVTNTNDFAVSNVSLENVIPEGYTLAEGNEATKQVESLEAGETASLTVTYVPEDTGEQPGTGDNTGNTDTPGSGDNGGSTEQPGAGNDSGSSSNTGTGSNNTTSGNGTSGSGSNNSSTSPTTGDDSNIALWIALLVLACGGIVTLIALRKKSGKKLLSLFLCVAMVGSLATGISTKAYAEESRSNSIGVETTISVDETTLNILGVVTYEGLSMSDGTSLSNFAADETSFLSGYEADITFTVDATNVTNSVVLCDGNENAVGTMHDDGLDGDAVANDGTYTYVMTTVIDEASNIDYYAKSGNIISGCVTICFFARPTEDSKAVILNAQEKMEEIEAQYADENGYISSRTVSTVIAEVAKYVEALYKEGTVIYYEINECNIIIQFSSGFMMVYSPNVEGVDSIGSDVEMTVITCQPCLSMYSTSSIMSLIDDGANIVGNTFNNYSFTGNYDNNQVTLDRIKSFSSNQIILWHGHGGYSSSKHSYLLTGEDFDWNAWWWDPVYCLDNLQGRIIESNTGRACITSKYITKYCGNLNNDLIYIATCLSGKDNTLANAFLNKGATAVVANTETIYTEYNLKMQCRTMQYMVEINSQTGNYYTLSEALTAAKNDYGDNDIVWAQNVGITNIKSEVAAPAIFGGSNASNYRFADAQIGTLSGKICKASDRTTPVTEANIAVYKNNSLYKTLSSDNTGNYNISLPIDEYRIEITADGYISFTAYASVTENNNTYMETFLMVEGSEDESGIASGTINNALTGKGIEGVTLEVRSGWNNAENGEIFTTVTTDSSGNYNVTLPLGNYTLNASKDGYISTMVNIIVQSGTTLSQNGTMTPIISGDNFRIVLTWGANPRDLDSHVVGTLSSGNSFHVYYSHKSQYDGEVEVCNLDVDDTSSYGPETITLNTTTDTPYYYYIYRFAGSGTVASSEAQVKLYQGETLVATFNVPTDQGSGDYWNVFAIVNGELVIRNTITSAADTSYAISTMSLLSDNLSAEDILVVESDTANSATSEDRNLDTMLDTEKAEPSSEFEVVPPEAGESSSDTSPVGEDEETEEESLGSE